MIYAKISYGRFVASMIGVATIGVAFVLWSYMRKGATLQLSAFFCGFLVAWLLCLMVMFILLGTGEHAFYREEEQA